ncbi:PilX N-terminal domain-containing pilus assembly protein [Brachymonas sp.]|uniref:pilus assembly PilX family protein n=1 Tax=Brachymonas sp. TaxID=1936292 RepID=UPI0035AF185A
MSRIFASMPRRTHAAPRRGGASQRGVALIVVLLLLVIVSILGAAAARLTLMAERSARNDRDMQIAWQASEAALLDAEMDIHGPDASSGAITGNRSAILGGKPLDVSGGCGKVSDGANQAGLCQLAQPPDKPAWLTVDFLDDSSAAHSVAFGTYTGRTFAAGNSSTVFNGSEPARAPRYVIEAIPDLHMCTDASTACRQVVYRITAIGFGPREDIQAVTQELYRN